MISGMLSSDPHAVLPPQPISYQVCLAERSIFTKEILGIALQRVLDLDPLPLLCMRTAMQALITH